jgi:hypothetical protein
MSISEDEVIPRRLIRNLLWDRSYPVTLRSTINKLHRSASLLEPVLYTSGEVLEILEKYPEYRETYHNFPRKIMRADMARLLILYDHGGWYFDLDIKPAQNSMDDFIRVYEHRDAVVFIEGVVRGDSRKRDPDYDGYPSIRKEGHERGFEPLEEPEVWIGNCFMGAKPGQGIIRDMLDEIVKRSIIDTEKHEDRGYNVLYLTGPNCITTAFHNNRDRYENIAVVEKEESERYFRHKMSGTWRRQMSIPWK